MKAEHDATVAKIKATWPQGRTFDVGNVPDLPVTPYHDVAVAAGTPTNYRVAPQHSRETFRAVVRSFGRDVAEVSFAAEKADAALLNKRVADGYSPCRRELASSIMRDPDGGGLLFTVHTYTFTKSA